MNSPPSCRALADGEPAQVAHKDGLNTASGDHLTQGAVTGWTIKDADLDPGIFHVLDVSSLDIGGALTAPLPSLPPNGAAAAQCVLIDIFPFHRFRPYQVKDRLHEAMFIRG